MAYSKTNWENLPSTNTPINQTNLNKIENELEILDNGQNNLQTQINDLPKKAKLIWGTSMSFQMNVAQHALVMLNDTDCLIIWAAGTDPENPSVTFIRLVGTDVNVSITGKTITLSYTDNRNFTGNAIIT